MKNKRIEAKEKVNSNIHSVSTIDILKPAKLYIRLYVISAQNLTPAQGSCDPYLVVKFGKNKTSLINKRQYNTTNPNFYESFEFATTLPGTSTVTISVFDWERFSKDLIGETRFDVEDRWFSSQWRELNINPIETRKLYNPTSIRPQGTIKIWIDILDPNQKLQLPLLDIRPPPPLKYELRLIIWGVTDVHPHDALTKMNDLYVKAIYYENDKEKEFSTDTHWRSFNGIGNFNWRIIFPAEIKPENCQNLHFIWPRLQFQICDSDITSFDDYISDVQFDLEGLFKKSIAFPNQRIVVKEKGQKESGIQKLWLKNLKSTDNDNSNSQGNIHFSLELIPKNMVEKYPAGKGRDEPNQYPYLPPPQGRAKFQLLDPLTTMKEILGKKFFDNILKFVIGIAFLFFLLVTLIIKLASYDIPYIPLI